MKRILTISTIVIAALLATSCQPVQVIKLVNEERAAYNLKPLQNSNDLGIKAQRWADAIAQEGKLVHSNLASEINSGWHIVGENLAVANSIEEIHRILMESPSHRANILNPRFTHVGIGVTQRTGHMYWVVQVFAA